MPEQLILSPIGKHYLDLDGVKDDYLVFCNDEEIGRINKSVDTPDGKPWLWSITAEHAKREWRKLDRGASETKEGAMMAFKAAWRDFNRLIR